MYNFICLLITAIIISETLKISKIIDLLKENIRLYKRLISTLLKIKINKNYSYEKFFKILSYKIFLVSFKIILIILIITGSVLFLNIFCLNLILQLFSLLGMIKISILIFFYMKIRSY